MRYIRVTIEAPSRLAFTLINLGMGSDRINGGAGVALSQPTFKCQVEPNPILSIQSTSATFQYVTEVTEYLERLLDYLNCPPVQLTVIRQIPSHMGFGSKTATLLSVGRAVAALYNKRISTPMLAKIAHRARTSGIGVNTFDRGGFVIDGGHAIDFNSMESSDLFVPTRFSKMQSIPPLLFHYAFPWPLIIIIPFGQIIEGDVELAHFRKVCPIPRSSVHEIAHIVCFRMASAIVENDYRAFCRAVNDLQQTHWKASQIEVQSDELRYVLKCASKHGFEAIGISSNGPALYGFSMQLERVEKWLAVLIEEGVIQSFWQASVPKRGSLVLRT